jgi:arylsulfatase A-like enzyme
MTVPKKSHKLRDPKVAGQEAAAPRAIAQPRCYLLLAIWFTIIAGFLELGILWGRVFFQGQVLAGSTNPHLPWRTLLAELLIYGTIGGALFLWAKWRPRWLSLGVAGFLMGLPLVFTLRGIFSQTPWHAWVVLNVGVAVGIGRLASSFFHGIRRTLWVLVPAALLLCLSVGLKDRVTEYRAMAGLPPAKPAPNVLLVVLDTVRAQSMSLYGYQLDTTPRIAEWAQRGVCFERAVAPSSWTLPSHVTFLTGHMPHEIFDDWRRMTYIPWQLPMDEQFPTLGELLAAEGYRTGGFVANWTFCDRVFGLARGFAHYEDQLVFDDYGINVQQLLNSAFITRLAGEEIFRPRTQDFPPLGTSAAAAKGDIARGATLNAVLGRKDAPHVNAEFLKWVDKDKSRPFFAFLNYMDCHDPYIYHDDCAQRLKSKTPGGLANPTTSTPMLDELAPLRLVYESSLAYLDGHIGALLDELERRELLSSTIVIITSDHGDHFGEHNLGGHGNSLYSQLLHVPLVVIGPGQVPAGVRVAEPASLANLAATVLDIARVGDRNSVPGKSLAPFWKEGNRPHVDPIYSELDLILNEPKQTWIFKMRSVIDEGYHYIVNHHDGKQQLFNWIEDPYEERNLARKPEQAERIERLDALVSERRANRSQ